MARTEDRRRAPWGLLALVAIGGAAGVLARVSLLGLAPPFVVVTVINIVGSFLIGLLVSGVRGRAAQRWALPLIGTGFLGGFTTLSAVSAAVIHDPNLLTIGLSLSQVTLGTGAALAGLVLMDRLRPPLGGVA